MIEYRVVENDDDEYYELSDPVYDMKDDAPQVAEEAAQDYFRNYDGLETDWPLTFALYSEKGGKEVCRYKVTMEQYPIFASVVSK